MRKLSKPSKLRTAGWVAAVLSLLGCAAFALRSADDSGERLASASSVWQLTLDVAVRSDIAGGQFAVSPPWDTPTVRVFGQGAHHPGIQIRRAQTQRSRREVLAEVTAPGKYPFSMTFMVQIFQQADKTRSALRPGLSQTLRERYLEPEEDVQSADPEVVKLASELLAIDERPAEFRRLVVQWARTQIAQSRHAKADDARTVILVREGDELGTARAAVALLRAGGVPARLVSGFRMRELRNGTPDIWIEAYESGLWNGYDPTRNVSSPVPSNYVPMRRGSGAIVTALDGVTVNVQASVTKPAFDSTRFEGARGQLLGILYLNRLPTEIRSTLALLLLLPFGVLITLLIRNLGGVRTYGTFTATLLALTAVSVDWVIALMVSGLVVLIGLAGLTAMPRLRLARTPRLGIVFTIVIVGVVYAVSSLSYFRIAPDSALILIPVVVLTSLVDRIYATTEQDGALIALMRLLWTLGTAIVCYGVFIQDALGTWLLSYPEFHFFTIAIVVLISACKTTNWAERIEWRWLWLVGDTLPATDARSTNTRPNRKSNAPARRKIPEPREARHAED